MFEDIVKSQTDVIKELYQWYEGEPHEESHQSPNIADKLQFCDPHFSLYLHIERVSQEYPNLHQIVPRLFLILNIYHQSPPAILSVSDGSLLYLGLQDDAVLFLLIIEDPAEHLLTFC